MIPLFKVISLLIRLFTRPLSNHIKNSLKAKNDHHPIMKETILNLGQFSHSIHIKIQRRLINFSNSDSYVKPLSEEKALDSGAELFGEIIAYGAFITWGLYEFYKLTTSAKAKEEKYNEVIAQIHARLQGLEVEYKEILNKPVEINQENKPKIYVDADTETDE